MAGLRIVLSNVAIWTITFFVPLTYLSLLPTLSYVSPFGKTGTFSTPSDDPTISSYLQSAPANGGFAVFLSPAVAYAVINPITRSSYVASFGSIVFAFGYICVVLFPVGYASNFAHSVGFFCGVSGYALLAVGLITSIDCSKPIIGWFCAVIICNITASLFYFAPSIIFLIFEYVNALFILSFAPLVNTFGKRSRVKYIKPHHPIRVVTKTSVRQFKKKKGG